MSEYIRLQANGADAYPDASTENTYRPNGTSVENALVNLESNVTTLGGVAGEAKTLAEQNSVKIATAEQEISDINSSLNNYIKVVSKSSEVINNNYLNINFSVIGYKLVGVVGIETNALSKVTSFLQLGTNNVRITFSEIVTTAVGVHGLMVKE